MPLQATSGAASYDAFGGGVAAVPNYIEDVFSTWLYTGTGANQTITNGIDLAGKGGMVWNKPRNFTSNHTVYDTARGPSNYLITNQGGAQVFDSTKLPNFLSNGFNTGADLSQSTVNYASWTFRKQPKFFDVVTYTGNGSSITVNHNLGSVPGMIIVKNLSQSDSWLVWHRGMSGFAPYMFLESTQAVNTVAGISSVSSTSFTYPWNYSTGNGNGQQYVAYVFAHNAGGFGLTGTDNVISCGSYTGGGTSGVDITLGYEPQWVMIKRTDTTGNWTIIDTMRGFPVGSNDSAFWANTSNAELSGQAGNPTATGFYLNGSWSDVNTEGGTYIYVAIRRGPMKVPTTGTSVFAPAISTNNLPAWNSGFPVDMGILGSRAGSDKMYNAARLMGDTSHLKTNTTDAAANFLGNQRFDQMSGYGVASTWGTGYMGWMFRRAPGFFDVVCYTGNLTQRNINHNLTVIPELFIVKSRSAAAAWYVSYYKSSTQDMEGFLNTTAALTTRDWSNGNFGAASTTTTFSVGPYTDINNSGATYVAYLFASCPGVSKVGSYTGDGTNGRVINCGFTGGARFVLIKRTDNGGDWYVWDSARGIVSGNDPYLVLNKTDPEITSNDTIDPDSSGFIVNQTFTDLNGNGATYIFLAIA